MPADRRRADGSLHGADGEVARAELARVGREALELVLVEPDADLPVEDADRGRHRSGGADAPLAREPDLDAVRRREPVRDERRLERDDGALLLERGRTSSLTWIRSRTPASLARSLSGIDRLLHAARGGLERELRPADEPAGREGVAGAGRVDDLDGHRGTLVAVERAAARRRA